MKKLFKKAAPWIVLNLFFFISTGYCDFEVKEEGFAPRLLVNNLSNPQDVTNLLPGGGFGENLFVTEYGSEKVTKITPAGAAINYASNLEYPVAILFGRGEFGHFLYVSESHSTNGNIIKVHPNGSHTDFAAGIDSPLDMVWGPGGDFGEYLYVTSANANKIVRVAPAGVVTDFANELARPSVLAFSPSEAFGNYLYVTSSNDGKILRIDATGNVETFMDNMNHPVGMAFGIGTPFGDFLYVSDSYTGEIFKVSPSGTRSLFADGLNEPVEVHFCQGGIFGNDMLVVDGDGGAIFRVQSSNPLTVAILPSPADVDAAPFTLTFRINAALGISTVNSLTFLFNGVDFTAALQENAALLETGISENTATVGIPGVALPPGVYTIEVIVTDATGRTASAKVVYTVSQ